MYGFTLRNSYKVSSHFSCCHIKSIARVNQPLQILVFRCATPRFEGQHFRGKISCYPPEWGVAKGQQRASILRWGVVLPPIQNRPSYSPRLLLQMLSCDTGFVFRSLQFCHPKMALFDYDFKSKIYFNNNPLLIKIFDYTKKEKDNSILDLEGSYKKNKTLIFKNISFFVFFDFF